MHFLPFIWIGIIAFCIVMYVILDGFTLGTGMLMPLLTTHEKDIATSVLLPTWDGNQTWLVLGGALLYGAFPTAFSALLPFFYLPLLLMVVALIFRGVIFEFRLKATTGRELWDIIFAISSFVITAIQGLIVGNFVQGFIVVQSPYLISSNHVFSYFSLFSACSLIFGYMLLGSTRLILKTENKLQQKMYTVAWVSAFCVAACLLVVSLWTPLINDKLFLRWFSGYNWLYLSFLPLITSICFFTLLYALKNKYEKVPYYISIGLFLCPYLGFMISLYPYIIPYQITFLKAASPNDSLLFMLVGAMIMLPVLLFYTWYAYRIFRGKVKAALEY